MRQGRLFVISGPSGAGKGTICRELLKVMDMDLSVSMTTRKPRGTEQEGVSYFFVSHEVFQQTIDAGGLLEWAEIYENRYGTPKAPVLEKLAKGRDVILEIEMQGAQQVKKNYPQSVLIFVLPPSIEVLRARLTARGTETPEQIELRLRTTLEEIRTIRNYDYYIVNDELEEAVEAARAIISAEHSRAENDAEYIISKYESEVI